MPVQEKNMKYTAIAKQIKDPSHSAERRPPVQKKGAMASSLNARPGKKPEIYCHSQTN